MKQAGEYAYDANGNLVKDLNKGISEIQYNSLNLPCKVEFSDGSTIEYVYAADGTKLRTKHVINGTVTTTDYCGNVLYENASRIRLLTGAGYVSFPDGKYHYYLQDHLGNNRVVADQSGHVRQIFGYLGSINVDFLGYLGGRDIALAQLTKQLGTGKIPRQMTQSGFGRPQESLLL